MSKAIIEIEEVDGEICVSMRFIGHVDSESGAQQTAIDMVSDYAEKIGMSRETLVTNMIASMEVVRG